MTTLITIGFGMVTFALGFTAAMVYRNYTYNKESEEILDIFNQAKEKLDERWRMDQKYTQQVIEGTSPKRKVFQVKIPPPAAPYLN